MITITCIHNIQQKFWQIRKITSDSPKFRLQITSRNICKCETVWIALLKYIQLKTTCKQPLPEPDGELSVK